MKQTAKQIKEFTGLEGEKVEILADELDRIQELKVLWKSDAGKALLARLVTNCEAALTGLYGESDLTRISTLVASYKANIDLLGELQDISAEDEISRQLDEAVKEAAHTAGIT